MTENEYLADPLGVAGMGDSMRAATQETIDGAGAFILRACPEAAEEMSLLFKERMGVWRAVNLTKILNKANTLLETNPPDPEDRVNPRLLQPVLEAASWCDGEEIQNLWAGLLASGTSPQGASDENLVFMNLFRQLSSLEIRILAYAATNAGKTNLPNGMIRVESLLATSDQLSFLFEGVELIRLLRELGQLKKMGLIKLDNKAEENHVNLAPTQLGIDLFIRAQGSKQSPAQFFTEKPQAEMFANQDYDPELKSLMVDMEGKFRESLATAIDKKNMDNRYPPLAELKGRTLSVLFQLAQSAGVTLPPPLAQFPLLILKPTIPLAGDPEWKKVITKSEYGQLAKHIDEFVKKVGSSRGANQNVVPTNFRSKSKPGAGASTES